MFLNKFVLLAKITSVSAGIELILTSIGTGTEFLNPARMKFQYISNTKYLSLKAEYRNHLEIVH